MGDSVQFFMDTASMVPVSLTLVQARTNVIPAAKTHIALTGRTILIGCQNADTLMYFGFGNMNKGTDNRRPVVAV